MTGVQYVGGLPYLVQPIEPAPVFVADARVSSSALAGRHTGPALLVARLEPVRPAQPFLCRVRLPDGTLREVSDMAIASRQGLAARRILPGPRRIPTIQPEPAA
jgi:hypothetical protein